MALAGDINSVLPLPEEPDVSYDVRSMLGRVNPIGTGVSSWMGRDPAGERTLAAFDGMNKSTWQPATNAIGCKVVVQEDAPEQVMYRKGMLGWWMGDDLSTKKVSRHSVQPRTSVIFPEETGTKYKATDIEEPRDIVGWKIAFPVAVETFIKRRSPITRVNFSVDQVAEIAINPKNAATLDKARKLCGPFAGKYHINNQSHLVPGTKIWCRAYRDVDSDIVTTCIWVGEISPADYNTEADGEININASPLIFLGSLIDTFNQGDPHLRVSMAAVEILPGFE